MDGEKTRYYLKTLHRALNIPIIYGIMGKELHYYQPFSPSKDENDWSFIVNRLQHVFRKFPDRNAMYFISPELIMLGIVVNHKTGEMVFIGPLATPPADDRQISDYLFASGLSADTTRKVKEYMSATRPLPLEALQQLLVSINVVINDEILSTKELAVIYDSETANKIVFTQKQFMTDGLRDEQQNVAALEEYEQKLNWCVINGDLDGLTDSLNKLGEMPLYENDFAVSLQELKITAFGSIFAAETMALKSGVTGADLGSIKQYYLSRIDGGRDADEIRRLIISALFDFTKFVKDNSAYHTGNPTVNRAINYIKSNINTKLLAEDIATALKINLHYLFTKFKSETGKTLTEFVTEEKIKKACYYLMFTDKSLAEISVYLSFSSQSYFQTVFKKVKGETPTEWRKKNTYVK